MPILFRYITKEILKSFAIVMAVVIILYVAIDFFEKIDNFMEAGVPVSRMAVFLFFRIPFIVVQTTPLAVLLSSLVTFTLMNRRNEIIALRSSGIGRFELFRPAAVTGAGLCVILFLFSEGVVPEATSRANFIWLQQVRQKISSVDKRDDVWLKDGRLILHVRRYRPMEMKAYDLTINYMTDGFRVGRRIDAAMGLYSGGQWTLRNVMDQRFDNAGNLVSTVFKKSMSLSIDLAPGDLLMAGKSAAEMGLAELMDTIREIEAEGDPADNYRVDLYAKFAYPFLCLLMVMLGACIGGTGRIRGGGGVTANIAYGMGLSFVYWTVNSFCISLGYRGVMPPFIAAWAANIILACLTCAFFASARH